MASRQTILDERRLEAEDGIIQPRFPRGRVSIQPMHDGKFR